MRRKLLFSLTVALCGVLQVSAAPTLQPTVGGSPLDVTLLTTTSSQSLTLGAGSQNTFSSISPFVGAPQAMIMPATFGSSITATGSSMVIPNQPIGDFSLTQMMPPAPVNYVPPTTANSIMQVNPSPLYSIAPVRNNKLEIAGQRPDFRYRPGRLEFESQDTHTTGQNGMGVGPGLPPGSVRYVPVGEF